MKNHSLSIPSAITGLLLFFTSGLDAQPGFRSDVQKEYDENGNITRFDSCWSWSFHGGHSADPVSLSRLANLAGPAKKIDTYN